jgi:hypothetical protein
MGNVAAVRGGSHFPAEASVDPQEMTNDCWIADRTPWNTIGGQDCGGVTL